MDSRPIEGCVAPSSTNATTLLGNRRAPCSAWCCNDRLLVTICSANEYSLSREIDWTLIGPTSRFPANKLPTSQASERRRPAPRTSAGKRDVASEDLATCCSAASVRFACLIQGKCERGRIRCFSDRRVRLALASGALRVTHGPTQRSMSAHGQGQGRRQGQGRGQPQADRGERSRPVRGTAPFTNTSDCDMAQQLKTAFARPSPLVQPARFSPRWSRAFASGPTAFGPPSEPAPAYAGHVPINLFQRSLLIVGSAVTSLIDTHRHGPSALSGAWWPTFPKRPSSAWLTGTRSMMRRHGRCLVRDDGWSVSRSTEGQDARDAFGAPAAARAAADHGAERQPRQTRSDASRFTGQGICRLAEEE